MLHLSYLKNFSKNPHSNTGFNGNDGPDDKALAPTALTFPTDCVEAGLDWLQGTCLCLKENLQIVIPYLLAFTGGQPIYLPDQGRFMGVYWDNTVNSSCGFMALWKSPNPTDPECPVIKMWISFPGSSLARCSRLFELLHFFASSMPGLLPPSDAILWDFIPTRIDVKSRSSSDHLQFQDILDAVAAGNFTGCGNSPKSITLSASGLAEGKFYPTLYMGSPQSDSMTRFYDPFIKHVIEGAIDIEIQLKDSKAIAFLHDFRNWRSSDDPDHWLQILAAVSLGQISFIDRSSADRPCRCKLLSFWHNFLTMVCSSPIKIFPTRPIKTFEKSLRWIEKQVFPTLHSIQLLWPNQFEEWLEYLLDKLRLSPELSSLIFEALEHNISFPYEYQNDT